MKVLWFEMKVPGRYQKGHPIGGWQDALENIICKIPDIELLVAFKTTERNATRKIIDGVTYIPIYYKLDSMREKFIDKLSWEMERDKIIPLISSVVNEFSPDIVQVFGTEWPYGQVQQLIDIPVVAHMQGSIPPYHLSKYPPGYSNFDNYRIIGCRLQSYLGHFLFDKKSDSRKNMEIETLKCVNYYLGRTSWDKCIVSLFNPKAHYYYCAEALRECFYSSKEKWKIKEGTHRIKIVTTGCSSYVKGMNILLLTAKVLYESGVDFEWNVVGDFDRKKEIEKHERLKFSDYNVHFKGYLDSEQLKELLLDSDMYVHLAYIENSPNSICEAQILGLPIIATYVGGVPDLIHHGEDGLLIPSNDPYMAAYSIIQLGKDKDRQMELSQNAIKTSKIRHNRNTIANDLINAYKKIIEDYNK